MEPIVLHPFDATATAQVVFDGRYESDSVRLKYRICNGRSWGMPPRQPSQMRFERVDELWKNTCLEWFVGADKPKSYLEYNFALDGRWNSYRFSDYREGMQIEENTSLDAATCRLDGNDIIYECTITLPPGVTATNRMCPTAVLKRSGVEAPLFLAPKHLRPHPDFHWKDTRQFRL